MDIKKARKLLYKALDPWTEIKDGEMPTCRERNNDYKLCGKPATRIAGGSTEGVVVCEKCANTYYAHSTLISDTNKDHWVMVHNLIERALDELE